MGIPRDPNFYPRTDEAAPVDSGPTVSWGAARARTSLREHARPTERESWRANEPTAARAAPLSRADRFKAMRNTVALRHVVCVRDGSLLEREPLDTADAGDLRRWASDGSAGARSCTDMLETSKYYNPARSH
eukprot:618608-Prorocentrum_minimum.AAC.4